MLSLRTVRIEQYRGVEFLEIGLGPSTVLIGENNVGKTTVLAAIDACLGQTTRRRGPSFEDYDHRRRDTQGDLPDGHELAITLTFAEEAADEWSDDVSSALSDVIQLDGEGRKSILMRVTDTYDATERIFASATTFLNLDYKDLRKGAAAGRELRRFAPCFYLPAGRDASTDFRSGSPFWAPFLRDPQIPSEVRLDIEKRLHELNQEIISAAPNLERVRSRLEQVRDLVDVAHDSTASLEPMPERIPDLLRRTEVRVAGPSGARLPLVRHGGGTQNVAVLTLFQAYLESMLQEQFERDTTPILAIEEPEAHLHPSATRAAWALLDALPGQRVVATHSGELLSRAPLADLRRLSRTDGGVAAYQLHAGALDETATRKVDFHVRRTRGELLFARTWILVEGEADYWILQAAAEARNVDLERAGIRILEFAQTGPGPLGTLGDQLGISWHFVVDGDGAGQKYAETVRGLLDTRPEESHLTVLAYENIEHLLCEEGFGAVYESELVEEQRAKLTTAPGDAGYWREVACLPNSRQKTRGAVAVADLLRSGKTPVPPSLISLLESVDKLGSK